MKEQSEELFEKEIKNELQLERMILFSDAVFAIVITLMAIELRIPESEHNLSSEEWGHIIKHLFSVFAAYLVSFSFIGMLWYRHLKIFSLLNDYDGGLVFRNMLLLFFIGLFPFGASVVTTPSESMYRFVAYAVIILLCISSQYALQYYILIQRPELRNNQPVEKQLLSLKISRVVLIALTLSFIFVAVTYNWLNNENKPLAFLWFVLFVITVRIARKKYRPQAAQVTSKA